MASILKGFLDANLLPIGDGDEKLQHLEAAAAELSLQIAAKPLLAYRFALVGLDGRVPATDPVHQLVEAAATAKWHTMKNKTGAAPTQIYRGVALRALQLVASEKSAIGSALILIAQNTPSIGAPDDAKDAVRSMFSEFAANSEKEMIETWVTAVDFSQTKLGTKIKKPAIKDEMAPGVTAETVAAALQAALKGYAEDMQEALRETMQTWVQGLNRLSIRDAKSELLWMSASRYSSSAARGLIDLSPAELVLHTMLDVSRAVQPLAPPSVEFFLRELVHGTKSQSTKLAALLTEIGPKLAETAEGKAIGSESPLGPEGRCSWLERILRPNSTSFEQQTGVPEDYSATLGELAVNFYRELQIRKLLNSQS